MVKLIQEPPNQGKIMNFEIKNKLVIAYMCNVIPLNIQTN